MSRPFIVLGDATDHGGSVIEASVMSDTHGKGIARVGDRVTCPRPGHGTTVIVTGDPTMIIDGQPAARHGDKCACGAILISSQAVSTLGGGGGGSGASGAATGGAVATASSGRVVASATDEQHDQCFQLCDQAGRPLNDQPYVLMLSSGQRVEGRTDAEGKTQRISGAAGDEVSLEVLSDEPPLKPGWDH